MGGGTNTYAPPPCGAVSSESHVPAALIPESESGPAGNARRNGAGGHRSWLTEAEVAPMRASAKTLSMEGIPAAISPFGNEPHRVSMKLLISEQFIKWIHNVFI